MNAPIPRSAEDRGGPMQPLLIVRDLKKHFPATEGGPSPLGFLPRDGAILRLAWLTACEQPVTNASGNGINGARKSHYLRHLAIGRRMRRRLTARLSPLFKAAKRSPDWPLSALP
jgi:hypothetical protein